jgi:tetratricopeptide (TPR) repeat protein
MLKYKVNIILALLIAFFVFSCGEMKKTEEQYLTSAKTLVDSAVAKNDNNLFNDALKTYKEFLKEYPGSQKTIFAMQQIANLYSGNLKNYPESINTYNELISKYPDSKEARQAMFMIAFIYDNMLQDKTNAITAYEKFLAKYPADQNPQEEQFSSNAKVMLEKLKSGKSDEDFINSIIEKEDKKTDKKDNNLKEDSKNPDLKKIEPDKDKKDVQKPPTPVPPK